MTKPAVALEILACAELGATWEQCKPRLGLKKAIDELVASGCYILIHTVLLGEDGVVDEQAPTKVASWLKKWNIDYDMLWTGYGKPVAKWYVETFEDLLKLAKERKEK